MGWAVNAYQVVDELIELRVASQSIISRSVPLVETFHR